MMNSMNPDAAWRLLMQALTPLAVEACPLPAARNRYLAEAVCADRDIPAADRAAMDGYALRAADATDARATLRICGEVAAGSAARPVPGSGECVRIMTGANLPPETDTVVRIEDTEADGDTVCFQIPVHAGRNILRQGENAHAGDALLAPGARLDAAAIALCAAVGCAAPRVHQRPRIGIVTTGSELKAADESVALHEIRDANGPMIAATLTEHGFDAAPWTCLPDDRTRLRDGLRRIVEQHEVTLVSGGVSVGRYDYVPEVVQMLGGVIQYHGLTMKPGKPQLFATLGRDRYLFGLPGNPLAVLTGLHEFVLPALRRLSGCPEDACRPRWRLPLLGDAKASGGRRQYLIARLCTMDDETGVMPIPNSGSSDFVSGCRADGMIVFPDGVTALQAGSRVDYRPWRGG